jgi:hypothetical protein
MNAPASTDLVPITPSILEFVMEPAKVSANFDYVKDLVERTLDAQIMVVTPETIPGCKSMCADLRKTSKAFSAAWKERRDICMSDILQADKDVKFICTLVDNAANEIAGQVKEIEDKTKVICAVHLAAYVEATWIELDVDKPFQKAEFDDLVLLGSLTPKGELTKACKDKLEQRCKQDKAWQDKIASRLMMLENECLKEGINPPLTRASVEHMLYSLDDNDYARRLKALIDGEADRLRKVEALARERAEQQLKAENQRKIDEALATQQAEANRLAKNEAEKAKPAPVKDPVQPVQPPAVEKPTLEQLNETLTGMYEQNARFPGQVSQKDIDWVKAEIKALEPVVEKPKTVIVEEGQIHLQVVVEYKTELRFPSFLTKAGTDREKIEKAFICKAVESGVLIESIVDVRILEVVCQPNT